MAVQEGHPNNRFRRYIKKKYFLNYKINVPDREVEAKSGSIKVKLCINGGIFYILICTECTGAAVVALLEQIIGSEPRNSQGNKDMWWKTESNR